MKAQTLNTRIERVVKNGLNTRSRTYEFAMRVLETGKSHTVYFTGSGRYTNTIDNTGHVVTVLTQLGIDYKTGNDAPRGGKVGNFVELTEKGKKQCKDYVNYLSAKRQEEENKENENKALQASLKAEAVLEVKNNISLKIDWYKDEFEALRNLRSEGKTEESKQIAKLLVNTACNKDFSLLKWKEVYDLIKETIKG